MSAEGEPGAPSDFLLELAVALIRRTREVRKLPALEERGAPSLIYQWPGEHYRLLSAIMQELEPKRVVEIGTFSGLSTLAMLPELKSDARLTTFDMISWYTIPTTYLRENDFSDGRLSQVIGDLALPSVFGRYASVLREADVLFIDGPKNYVFEKRLIGNFNRLGLKPHALLVFDDTRFWNMIEIWRAIHQPKLDFSSFGHWSGTGLVEWPAPALPVSGASV